MAPVGDAALFFSENGQRLYALTDAAAVAWRALAGGQTPRAVSRQLVQPGLPPESAEALVQELLAHWLENGDLYPQDLAHEDDAAHRLDLSIGDFAVRVVLEGGLDPEPFKAIFGQFSASAGAVASVYRLARSGALVFAFVDGRCLGAVAAAAAVPRLKGLLTEGLASSTQSGFLVHAGCLHYNGSVWLLSGPPGAGKTTLTTALVAAGFGYGSDDVTIIGSDGRVAGVPFAAALKEGAWGLCARFAPNLAELPIYRRADGLDVRYLPPPSPLPGGPSRLAGVLFLEREDGQPLSLAPLAPAEALTRILGASYSPKGALSPREFMASANALNGARSFVLTYSDLDEAVCSLTELADDV